MSQPVIRMLCSHISHMALHYIWRDSGVCEKHGFELKVDIANAAVPGQPFIGVKERAPRLLQGEYEFLSGLHHETYIYRAKGDKRFVYLAQAQNDWDDRIIARSEIRSPKDLEGKRMMISSTSACVFGNLKHSLELAGADIKKIDFARIEHGRDGLYCHQAVERVARGEASAASIDIPFDLQGEKRGLHQLSVPALPVIHNATICANLEWVKKNEEATLSFLRSMVDVIHFFKTQKEKVCAILEKNLAPLIGLEGADEIEHLHKSWSRLLSAKPYPHPLAVWNVYSLDVAHDERYNFIGPFEIWDTSYLRAIDDSGYIDRLYGDAQKAANPEVNALI